EDRSLPTFTLHVDRASMQVDNLTHDRKSKAGPPLLCGEEWLKQTPDGLLIHADAFIDDLHSRAWMIIYRGHFCQRRRPDQFSLNFQRRLRLARVDRIGD